MTEWPPRLIGEGRSHELVRAQSRNSVPSFPKAFHCHDPPIIAHLTPVDSHSLTPLEFVLKHLKDSLHLSSMTSYIQ